MLRLTWKEWLTAHTVFPFKVCLAFYGCSFFSGKFPEMGKNNSKILATSFSSLLHLHCYSQVTSFLDVNFRSFSLTNFFRRPSLKRYVKIKCEKCGTQTTKINLALHKKRYSAGTLYCIQCPNFSTKSQNDLNYHIARKHSASEPDVTFKCKPCYQEFPGFYALRHHKNTQHGMQIGERTRDVDVENKLGDNDDESLGKMKSCKHFLRDTEMENGRHRVFNFAMSSFGIHLLNDKLVFVFKEIKHAAKVIVAFGFLLKNFEYGTCGYFYTHGNNTNMERSKLVFTQADMTNLKDRMQKMDIVDICNRETANTKWKFY